MPREHGESGEYVETVTLDDVFDTFDHVDGPVILSADVADRLGCSRETARRKLETLYDRGDLDRRKVSRRVIYWRADAGGFDAADLQGDATTTLDDTDARAAGASDATETPPENENTESDHTHAGSDALAGRVREYLEREDLPPKTEHGRDAVIDVFRYLREHGTTKTGVLREHLVETYGDHYSGEKAMWESVRRYLKDVPGIEDGGYGKYAYAGDETVREELDTEESGIYDPTKEFE